MRIIAVINQKGGCGKTTTAINLSGCLAHRNRRVLLVDLDPQGHACLGLNLKPENLSKGMTEVLAQEAFIDDVICQTGRPGLDVAPSTITLSAAEQILANALEKEKRLHSALRLSRRGYDYAIIDSPPSLGLLTFNALRACDEAIVPIDMSFFSLHGLAKLTEIVDLIGRHTGHQVTVQALATMVSPRARFSREILSEIEKHFEGRFFKTLIRNNIRLREAASHGYPICDYAPEAHGALDYGSLADELIGMESELKTGVVTGPALSEVKPLEIERYLGPLVVEEVLTDPAQSSSYKSEAHG